jgi:hypothetical protein
MPTEAEMQAELEKLKAENAALKSRGSKGVSMKVSEKGGVSIYGLGRFPVTLYLERSCSISPTTSGASSRRTKES